MIDPLLMMSAITYWWNSLSKGKAPKRFKEISSSIHISLVFFYFSYKIVAKDKGSEGSEEREGESRAETRACRRPLRYITACRRLRD